MSILVVGSVAFDSLETPSGKRERVLGGAATHFALSASHFTKVRVVGVVGEDFLPEHEGVLTKRGVDTKGIERAPGKCFPLEGRVPARPERGGHARDRPQRLRGIRAEDSGRVRGLRVPLPREHRSGTAAACTAAHAEGCDGRRRHDELLD